MMDYSYEILDLLKKYDGDEQAALAGEKSPQCLYAFSPLRENLLEWAEIKKEDRVLQIGSDYGALTGLLSKKAGEVVVLDGRDENLEVNRLRHKDRENIRYVRGRMVGEETDGAGLSVIADGFGEQEYREYFGGGAGEGETHKAGGRYEKTPVSELMKAPFDYVVLIGYLGQNKKEWASRILSWAAGFLRPGGTLFAAAENEAGVRYWMGARHTEEAFLEAEFRGLFEELKAAHGGDYLIYYPVPDYRYPVTLYSDAYLPKTGDVTNISARLDGPGFWFGSEEEAMAKACQNGEFTKFANSFLGVWEKGNL